MSPSPTIHTIGQSNHPIDEFIALLRRHGIGAVADVRSTPFSRFNPQFNRERLKQSLQEAGMQYVFLGKELGARSEDPAVYVDDKVSYQRLAGTALFQSGLDRVIEGAVKYRVALMCAEREPLECHRTILVARHLVDRGCSVVHILADGSLEGHEGAVRRLLGQLGLASDMFRTVEAVTEEAYARQGMLLAYDRSTRRS